MIEVRKHSKICKIFLFPYFFLKSDKFYALLADHQADGRNGCSRGWDKLNLIVRLRSRNKLGFTEKLK